MKSYLFFIGSIFPCIIITTFLIYPAMLHRNRVLKIGKQFVIIDKHDQFYEWNQMISKYLNFPLDHHYGSHAIVLLAALYATKTGPILELGMGSTSTPLLHSLSFKQKRILVSADSDRRWINYYSSFSKNNTLHKLKYVEVNSEMGVEWAASGLPYLEDWTVVFIDHRPGPRRQFEIMLYADRSNVVILHDTEQSSLYKYEQGLSYYPYKYRFTKLKTYTDVLSLKNESIINRIRSLLEATPNHYFSDKNF